MTKGCWGKGERGTIIECLWGNWDLKEPGVLWVLFESTVWRLDLDDDVGCMSHARSCLGWWKTTRKYHGTQRCSGDPECLCKAGGGPAGRPMTHFD